MVDVAAVPNRWHLVVLHGCRSRALWRARVVDLGVRSESPCKLPKADSKALAAAADEVVWTRCSCHQIH